MPIQISNSLPQLAASSADALSRGIPLSKFVAENVQLIFSPQFRDISDAGIGTLYVTTRQLIFLSSSNVCISIDYPTITIHAISRGENDRLVRRPCIYCQLELGGDNGDYDVVSEMRLVPNNESCLDELFFALNECAALNPDPEDDQAVEEENAFQGLSNIGLSAQGVRNLNHLESLLTKSSEESEEVIDR